MLLNFLDGCQDFNLYSQNFICLCVSMLIKMSPSNNKDIFPEHSKDHILIKSSKFRGISNVILA
jgi:hypothetical protein